MVRLELAGLRVSSVYSEPRPQPVSSRVACVRMRA
jgi:hypothetical protein